MLLGDRVKDRITGYTGIITAYVMYLHGCDQHLVVSDMRDAEGQIVKPFSWWIDSPRLEPAPLPDAAEAKTGEFI